MNAKLLSARQIVEITGLSKPTIYRQIARGEFPQQRRISPNRVGWDSEEIRAFLDALPKGSASKVVQ